MYVVRIIQICQQDSTEGEWKLLETLSPIN
jgi:hypothetical protein